MTDEAKQRACLPDYWWFQGETVLALKDLLANADENTIFKCRPDADGKLWLSVSLPVTDDRNAVSGELNDSFICPPHCT